MAKSLKVTMVFMRRTPDDQSQQALQQAQELAAGRATPRYARCIAAALCGQADGIVAPILQRWSRPESRRPRQRRTVASDAEGPGMWEIQLSGRRLEFWKRLKSSSRSSTTIPSTEHMLLAIARGKDEAAEILRRFGGTETAS